MAINLNGIDSDHRAAVNALVARLHPHLPLEVFCPRRASNRARHFCAAFPGRVLYAVKCNPDPALIKVLWAAGVRDFDAASVDEIALIRQLLPQAGVHFMHPIKTFEDIAEAYGRFGVRTFAVDGGAEGEKVFQATRGGRDVTAVLRLAVPPGTAGRDLSGKFGTPPDQAAAVLAGLRDRVAAVGLTFHVGSQCLDASAFAAARAMARQVAQASGGPIAVLDVGGGFAVDYQGCVAPPASLYAAALSDGDASWFGQMWCEPGRALAAESTVLVARVIARKGNALFLNDGIYGGLNPEPLTGYRYPAWVVGTPSELHTSLAPFTLYGPTCDSHDRLPLPYDLPETVAEGDWIAFDRAGAYGSALRTRFNGYGAAMKAVLED